MSRKKPFSKKNLSTIIKNIINCDICNDEIFGEILVFTPQQAFRLLTTVESFLLRDNIGDQYFGTLELFSNACDYNIADGIMIEDRSLGYINKTRTDDLLEKYPDFFNSKKKIIFVNNNNAPSTLVDKVFSKIKNSKSNTTEFLLVQLNINGANWEHIFEYLISELYISQGYVVDNQLPWNNYGTPDIAMYKIEGINNGFHVKDLLLMQYVDTQRFENLLNIDWKNLKLLEFIVGEVKTFQTSSQIEKYTKTGWPSHSVDYVKMETFLEDSKVDSISFFDQYPKSKNIHFDEKQSLIYFKWLISYLQLHLLASYGKQKMCDIVFKNKSKKINFDHLKKLVISGDLNNIIKSISET